MRTEKEMLDIIIDTAREDERVRAVIMNGSRVNPNIPPDAFRDFDIIYVVTDPSAFRADERWIDRFGEIMLLQMPEEMGDPTQRNTDRVVYLMQFMDGNRIDLTLFPLGRLRELEEDSLSLTLLDKDCVLPVFPAPSESSYLPDRPTRSQFEDCCNEFWWVSLYVAKGLLRGEIAYAHHMLDVVSRSQLMNMLTWQIGEETGYTKNPGKFGRNFQVFLQPGLWQQFLDTYADAEPENMWDALFAMCDLFRRAAVPISVSYGFTYPADDDRRASAYLHQLRACSNQPTFTQH